MNVSLGTILPIILILILIGALPTWPYSSGWGYYPSGGLGLVLVYSSDSGAIGSGLASVFTGANGRLDSVHHIASSTARLRDSDLSRTGEILPIFGGYSGG
jgi:hypothetical protein